MKDENEQVDRRVRWMRQAGLLKIMIVSSVTAV